MAGKKESPRQKMIGMMYLVLTALLALQVSSSIIERFQALNENLEITVDRTNKVSADVLFLIKDQVHKLGNKKEDLLLKEKAEKVDKYTRDMLAYIRGIKKQLIEETGGIDEDGNFKGAKEETQVEVIMIGASKEQGRAYQLKRKLDEYSSLMEGLTGMSFAKLAPDGKDDPVFSKHPEQRIKDYANLNFAQTPLVAALATLSETENRIANMQAVAFNYYASKLGIETFKADGLVPIVSPTSRVVAAGTKYEAHIGLAITGTADKPQMEVGGQTLEVDANGIGSYSFRAAGGGYVNGVAKRTWTGKVKVKKPNGTDTTYVVTEEYLVAQPVIDVKSASIQSLYLNCGNKLDVQVPALGTEYRPVITADGAQVEKMDDRGRVIVIPKSARVTLKVNSNGVHIGEQIYKVKAVPKPTIEISIGSQKLNTALITKGISKSQTRSITVRAIADKDFQAALPEDAQYKVTQWKLTIASGRTGSAPIPFNTEFGNVGQVMQNAKVGGFLIIEPVKVMRKNYKGQWEEVEISKTPFVVPITAE